MRAHGASLRLYSNGVFHSQWNPDRPFAGGVWDCLALPVLYRPPEALRTGLVLGVGGGAVLRQLESLAPGLRVRGVELDDVHIDIAVRWFGVPRTRITRGDAVAWLAKRLDARPDVRYDVVVDDLFGHAGGEPRRAVALDDEWTSQLAGAVSDEGLVIVNAIDGRQLKRAAPVFATAGFRFGKRWSLPAYENAIGVFSRQALHSRDWSRQLELSALPAASRRQARLCVQQPLRGL